MTALSDIIAEATDANREGGVIRRHDALNAAFERVRDDPDLAEQCIRADLGRRIKAAAMRTAHNIGREDRRQATLFGLRAAYALDDEAHDIKQTDDMTRAEFEGLISLRQQQVTADLSHLSKLRDALRQTSTIWDRNPGWLWRQVEEAYARQIARAA